MNFLNKRVLVTGANGFLGSTFHKGFANSGASCLGVTRRSDKSLSRTQVSDYSVSSLTAIFGEFRPEFLILSAGPASVAASVADPEADYASSTGLVDRVLTALRHSQIKPTIFFTSTAAVYGNPVRMPVKETDPTEPISPYGAHRLLSERKIIDFGNETGCRTVIGRAFSLFGPSQNKLVLWEMAKQALEGEQIIIQGSGLETRDFLSGEEFVRRAINLLAKTEQSVVVNLAAGESWSVKEVAQKIRTILAKQIEIVCKHQSRPGNPDHWVADTSFYRLLTNDNSTYDFDEDLRHCLQSWAHVKLESRPQNSSL